MADFVEKSGSHFRAKGCRVTFSDLPEIFQPEPDARGRRPRGALLKNSQGIGLDTGRNVVRVRSPFEKDWNSL